MLRLSIHKIGAKMTEFLEDHKLLGRKCVSFLFENKNNVNSLLLSALHCFDNVAMSGGLCEKFLF